MSGAGEKRPLPSTVSVVARGRAVRKAARVMAAMRPPAQGDREADEDMRSMATAAQAASVSLGTAGPAPPMVEFSAPPPPSLFDPSLLLSGSLAGGTRLPPLPALPGMSLYDRSYTGVHGFGAAGSAGVGTPTTAYGQTTGLAVPPRTSTLAASWRPTGLPALTAPTDVTGATAPLTAIDGVGATGFHMTGGEATASQIMSAAEEAAELSLATPAASVSLPPMGPSPAPVGLALVTAPATGTAPAGVALATAEIHRPAGPPALVVAGRRAGVRRRPHLSATPAPPRAGAVQASAMAAAAAPPTAAASTAAAALPTTAEVASTAAAASLIAVEMAATTEASGGAEPRGTAAKSVRKAGGKRATRKTSVVAVTAEAPTTSPQQSPATNEDAHVDSDYEADEHQNLALDKESLGKLMTFIASAKDMLTTLGVLSGNVGKLQEKVESNGTCVETLALAVNDLKKRKIIQAHNAKDSDIEEYSDYEEMKAFIGTGTVGGAELATTSAAAASHGNKLSPLQEGTLKMLRVRRRVKIRTYGRVGGATATINVVNDAEADWNVIVAETMDELDMDERDANDFLLSNISPPSNRKVTNKGKNKVKTVRAYQPIMQANAHVLEELKKKAVAAWMKEVKEDAEAMQPAEATEWLSNCRIEVGGALLVKPRFEASDRGIKGVVAAVKAIFVHLLVADRIKEPANAGDEHRVMTAWGHVALAACFVRCALERIERGGSGRRNGLDGGWYDRWRWEVLALKAFVPQSRAPWHGLIIDDATNEKLFSFPQDAVPFTSSRTLLALSTAVAAAEAAALASAEATAAGPGAAAAAAATEAAPAAPAATEVATAGAVAAPAAPAMGTAALSRGSSGV